MAELFLSLQFFLNSALIVVLAPIFYWLAGLPLGYATRRTEWSMLWGVGLVGLTGEAAGIMGISAKMATVVVACGGIAGGLLLIRSKAFGSGGINLSDELRRNVESYLISLLAVSFVPFAIPGSWGGDWLRALDCGQYIAAGKTFYPELLARPALFGAASIPACIVGNPLASFQIFCAVASASILQVARSFIASSGHPRLLWLFGGSLFFLQVTACAWPKFLAAAFVVASWISAGNEGRQKNLVTGILLGLAMATHQASVLFVPLLLVRLWKKNPSLRAFVPGAATAMATAALICAPWELYTILAYGLDAKIHANPSVANRIKAMPVWLNALLVGISTFCAWEPVVLLEQWIRMKAPLAPIRIQKEVFWLATSYFNGLAGSLAGIMVPWLAAMPFKQLSASLCDLWSGMPPSYRFALALSLAGQSLLNPYYSSEGSLQTGWVPVGAGMICWFMAWVSCRPWAEQGAVIRSTLLLGLVPWAAFHLVLTAGLVFSTRLKEQLFLTDDDLQLISKARLTPLGLGAFPWIQIAVIVGLIILYKKECRARTISTTGALASEMAVMDRPVDAG